MSYKVSKITFIAFLALIGFSYGQETKKGKQKSTAIDLSHWSITVPGEDPTKPGKPVDVGYPEILGYANNPLLQKWMYNDEKDNSIVFFAKPTGTTTANSRFSRSELRETMDPGNKNKNWTFAQGGYFKGTYKMIEVSKENDGKYSKVIIAQIHGRLSDEQRDLIGQKDNNAPPILKVYWDKGKIRVKTKVLKNKNASDREILETKAWDDDEGRDFADKVDFDKFTLEIKASDGRLEVILDGKESFVYDNINMKKWSVFENYFKAGNYFQSTNPNSYAKVKIYALETAH